MAEERTGQTAASDAASCFLASMWPHELDKRGLNKGRVRAWMVALSLCGVRADLALGELSPNQRSSQFLRSMAIEGCFPNSSQSTFAAFISHHTKEERTRSFSNSPGDQATPRAADGHLVTVSSAPGPFYLPSQHQVRQPGRDRSSISAQDCLPAPLHTCLCSPAPRAALAWLSSSS